MFMWKSYEKFASSTELHGFDQVLKYNKFWAAMWFCLTLIACGMCINDLINLAITYQSEPTKINLELVSNMNMKPPNPTLCMEIYVDMENQTFEDLANFSYTTEEIESDMKAFLTSTQNAENLNISYREELNLTDRLQYFTYLMLSYIAEAELTYIGHNSSVLTSFVTQYATAVVKGKFTNVTIGYLYQQYLSKNVSFANLKRLIGMGICQQRTYMITKHQRSTGIITDRICKPHMITHLSFSIVCSKLLEDNTEKLADYKNISLNGTKIMLLRWPTTDIICDPKTFSSTQVTFTWHLDLQGRPMLPVGTRQDVFSWNPTEGRAVDITVASEYHFYSTKRDPCQNAEKQYDCELNRRIKLMENKCGCRPSSLLYGLTDKTMPTCSENASKPVWILTNNTFNNLTYSNFTGICGNQAINVDNNQCIRDCKYLAFGIEYAQPSLRVIPGPGHTDNTNGFQYGLPLGIVEFTINKEKSRQLVEESAAKDFSTFICDFGGSIGAWLGASLMAFVHAAIHMLLTCYDTGKHLREKQKKMAMKIKVPKRN